MATNGREYHARHGGPDAPDAVFDAGEPVPLFEATAPPTIASPWPEVPPDAVPVSGEEADGGEEIEQSESGWRVRPYTRTGGRTRTDVELAIETLVVTSDEGKAPGAARSSEHRSICELCVTARSVAEVSAYLRLPLGVTKVLIGDLAGMGMVLIHHTDMLDDHPSVEFMERVLSGLRRL